MAFIAAGKSDVGITRKANQDSFLMLPKQAVYAVADGMGGHAGGGQASAIAIDVIRHALIDALDINRERVNATLAMANEMILEEAARKGWEGMGTTCALAFLSDSAWEVAHIGDSRVYVVKDKGIYSLTKDHSLVAELLANGSISADEARTHPHRNILTNALGGQEYMRIEWNSISIDSADYLLICSDGLHNMISDDEIVNIILAPGLSLDQKTTRLVDFANIRGGFDNITVILIGKGDGK